MPTANPDLAVTTTGSSIAIAVLANDDGDNLVLAGFTNPSNGSVTPGANGSLIYTPSDGFFGTDSFGYTVLDGAGQSAQGVVTINILQPNDPPIAQDDAVEILEGQSVVIPILDNDSDADGDVLILVAVTMPSHGSVEVVSGQMIRYTPQPSFTGIDSFRYTISDGRGSFDQATATINVRSNNAAPIVLDDFVTTAIGTDTIISPLANDVDPDGGSLSIVGFSLPSVGTLTINDDGTTFTYRSETTTEDGFTYTVRDEAGATATAFVAITVASPNANPQPSDDVIVTNRNTAVDIDVLANDIDPDGGALTIVALSLPSSGRIEVNSDQTLTFTPNTDFIGADEFAYTVRDAEGAVATARVSITVNETEDTFANGFLVRRRFVIPAQTMTSVAAENFVTLISIDSDDLRSAANGGRIQSDDGFDIRFEDDAGSLLDHDLEQYDPVNGSLRCWVRLPVWDLGEARTINLFYGNSASLSDSSAPTSVWQGYLGRWNTVTGADSTANGIDLIANGVQSGNLIGPAGSFDGNAVLSREDASFHSGLSALTVQAIVRADAAVIGTDTGILTEGTITGSDNPAGVTLQYLASTSAGLPNVVHFKTRTTEGNAFVLSSQGRHTTESQIIHGTWQAGEVPKLYIDGDFENSSASSVPRGGTTTGTGPFFIGTGPRNSANGGWQGLIDEVRFTDRVLPGEVIASEAINLAEPQMFYGVGPAEEIGSDQLPPIAVPLRFEIDAGTTVDIDVLTQAVNLSQGTDLRIVSAGQPENGNASVVAGQIRYAPNAGFSGTDSFDYVITNGNQSATASIRVTVRAGMSLDPILPNGQRVLLLNEAPLRTVFATSSNVQSVVNSARPGDHIVLRDGTYGSFSVNESGTETAPIVIVAENSLGANLTGQVTVRSQWLKFDGLRVTGGGHFDIFEPSGNMRFDRCRFENNTNTSIRARRQTANFRVSRCLGINGRDFFIYFDIDGPTVESGPQFAHIDHCFFTGYNNRSCIRLGDTSHNAREFELNAVVEYNFFDTNTGDRELIVGKSSRNWIRFNRMTGGLRGDVSIRQGSFWNVYGNYMDGAGGITVVATENNVFNNYIEGGVRGIWLMSGDNTWDRSSTQRPIYDRAEQCVIANNTVVMTSATSHGIGIGLNFGQDDFPVINCDVVNNLIFRVSGNNPLIERRAQSGNRLANNLVSVASGFTGTGVTVANPLLSRVDGVYRPTANSPIQGAGTEISQFGATNLTITDDINGVLRGSNFDIGAEQVSAQTPIRSRLEETDVGLLVDDPYEPN